MKPWKRCAYSLVCCVASAPVVASEVLLLEPKIQGYPSDQIVHATVYDGAYFLDGEDLADALDFYLDTQSGQIKFLGRTFSLADADPGAHLVIGSRDYYSDGFLSRRLPLQLMVNPHDMQLDVFSDEKLPTTRRNQNVRRAMQLGVMPVADSFDNYEFDTRYFALPVIDFIYRRNQNFYNIRRPGYSRSSGNFYQINSAMILGGLDTSITLFGDDYGSHKLMKPGARMEIGQTLLDEPPNALNLRRWLAGDIVSDGNNMFFYGAAGRGAMVSSFKDFVISADKTIDISGALPSGWEAELYLNNQLIGFRQSGVSGRYEFRNIPVNYGLNDFKVMLYGPFGEVREEQRRYYSGTSPVKQGELGYNITAQQPNKYIINTNNDEAPNRPDSLRANSTFYYGLTDRISLQGGLASAPRADDASGDYQFSSIGAQMALNGVSMQYNLNYNMTRSDLGHHFDIQGDVYFGTMFARYEYYGHTRSPISYYENEYLSSLFESRLTGAVPWIKVPYYVSYVGRQTESGDDYYEVKARLSPNFRRYYNFTVENTWSRNSWGRDDYTEFLVQATFGHLRMNGAMRYQTAPSNYLRDYGAFAEYRWDRNTYVQTTWRHERPWDDGDHMDIDSLGLGIGRIFKFGGITLTATGDTNKNVSVGLTYNISFGMRADRASLFTNAENQMKNYGTIYAIARDERDNPVPDVNLIVNGRESPSTTDENGVAIITNLEPYQKSTISVDENDIPDLSLTPAWTSKKLVLRPGTVRPVRIPFAHRGGIEGRIVLPRGITRATVQLKDFDGVVVGSTRTDSDGGFIIDGVPYGNYILQAVDKNDHVITQTYVSIETGFRRIQAPIE